MAKATSFILIMANMPIPLFVVQMAKPFESSPGPMPGDRLTRNTRLCEPKLLKKRLRLKKK
jgi:hypothetical protein